MIEINKIIHSSNNVTLRKVKVKPYGFYKMFMDKELIEDKLHQIIDKFIEKKIETTNYILSKIHPFMMEMVERVKYSLLMMI